MVNYFHLFQQKTDSKLVQTVLHGKLTVIVTSDQLRNKLFDSPLTSMMLYATFYSEWAPKRI